MISLDFSHVVFNIICQIYLPRHLAALDQTQITALPTFPWEDIIDYLDISDELRPSVKQYYISQKNLLQLIWIKSSSFLHVQKLALKVGWRCTLIHKSFTRDRIRNCSRELTGPINFAAFTPRCCN